MADNNIKDEEILDGREETDFSLTNFGRIKEVNISSEMKSSFLSYAMSVIVSRALPDVRDGFKPVQRRIVYTMNDLGIRANTAFKKSARIVGEVMGKYHPHGDSSVYEAMVRMAQKFSYHHPLVEGHGNFGSVDGDGAAAMRYTEARMSKLAMEIVKDLDKNTVDFVPNYDATEQEPTVLPIRFPNLLVNGATGIAVGMATNIPSHNLGEVIDAFLAFIDNQQIETVELMKYIQGPDFPTGGTILGLTGLKNAYETGNGIIAIRAKIEIVEQKNKTQLVITELPYGVNPKRVIETIAQIVKDKLIEGITGMRDESSMQGIRIVIDAKKDVIPTILINNLYKHTQLQTSFGINMIALVNGKPETVTLTDIFQNYLNFQLEIIQRRTQFLLEKAEARLHILEGLIKALNNIDKAIEIIKKSRTSEEARLRLIKQFKLDEIQAQAILDMKLQKLTGLEIENINKETMELRNQVKDYLFIIKSEKRKLEIIKEEALEVKEKYAIPRRSVIDMTCDLSIENEDLIPVQDVVITITHNGYIKRMQTDVYKLQNRSGVGMSGMKLYEDDYIDNIHMTSTHDYHLFFTNKGRVYKMKGYQIPEGQRQSRGLPLVNLLNFSKDEKFASLATVKSLEDDDKYLFFITKQGVVKRTKVSAFKNINNSGINAISLKDKDELIKVLVTDGTKDIILGATNGKAVRFAEDEVRSMGRQAAGITGMKLKPKESIVGIALIENENDCLLVVSEKGYGKKTPISEYRKQHRGGLGVTTLNITEKNGNLTFLEKVTNEEDLDLIVATDLGVVIRVSVEQISEFGRSTQGVRIIRLKEKQKVATAAVVPHDDEEETTDVIVDEEDKNQYSPKELKKLEKIQKKLKAKREKELNKE